MAQISFANLSPHGRLAFRFGVADFKRLQQPTKCRHGKAAPNTIPCVVRLPLALHPALFSLAPFRVGAIMNTLKVFELSQPCSDSACSTRSLTIPLAKPTYRPRLAPCFGMVDRTASGLEVSRPASHRARKSSPSLKAPQAPRCERTCTLKPHVGSIPDPTTEALTLTDRIGLRVPPSHHPIPMGSSRSAEVEL
jgi:hypothetical protein